MQLRWENIYMLFVFFFLYFKAKEITIDKFFLEREGVCDG
jgi:hypothetical protein